MKCKNCGFELDEGALFCRKCGTAAPAPEQSAAKKRGSRLPDLSKLLKNRRLLTVTGVGAAILIALILILCLATCGKTETRFQTADEAFAAAIDALKAGDGERLYAMTETSEPPIPIVLHLSHSERLIADVFASTAAFMNHSSLRKHAHKYTNI
jgi:uncharacterized membrane protein YvbJ